MYVGDQPHEYDNIVTSTTSGFNKLCSSPEQRSVTLFVVYPKLWFGLIPEQMDIVDPFAINTMQLKRSITDELFASILRDNIM